LEVVRDKKNLFLVSAFNAQAAMFVNENICSAVGLNPPNNPRADAQESFQRKVLETVIFPAAITAQADPLNVTPWILTCDTDGKGDAEVNLEDDLRFGSVPSDFALDEEETKWGLWFVTFERTELEDINSIREAMSAELYRKPFKSLPAPDKKELNAEIEGKSTTYVKRVQVPIFLDFAAGQVWIGTTSKAVLEQALLFFVQTIGQLQPMVMSFPAESAIEMALAEIISKDIFAEEHTEYMEKLGQIANGAKDVEATIDKDLKNVAVAGFETSLVTLQAPVLFVPKLGKGEVKAKEFTDALTLLATTGETLKPVGGVFTFKPVPSTQSKVSVDIVSGFKAMTHIYRNLDPDVMDVDLEETYYANPATTASSMHGLWLNWLGALRWSEKQIVAGIAAALTLDPEAENVGVLPLLESSEETVETE